MPILRDLDVQPLDLILFRGVDVVSKAIQFVERKKSGHGDFSHSGVAVTRDVLDLPFLEPGRIYVWESTFSATQGFWARFGDGVADLETEGTRFGVQLRDLEHVVPGYEAAGGGVSWVKYLGPRPPLDEMRKTLFALHDEYGHARYTTNVFDLLGVAYPALRGMRKKTAHLGDEIIAAANRVLASHGKEKRLPDEEHHVFCSEWCAIIYEHLGLTDADPLTIAPVTALDWPDKWATPVPIEPEPAAS